MKTTKNKAAPIRAAKHCITRAHYKQFSGFSKVVLSNPAEMQSGRREKSRYHPSPAFAAAERFAKTIPLRKHKRRAILHLCKKLRAALVAGV